MHKIKIVCLLAASISLHAQPGDTPPRKRPAISQEEASASDSQNQGMTLGDLFYDQRINLILAIDKLESSLGYPPEKRTRELDGEPMPDQEAIAAMRLARDKHYFKIAQQERLYCENRLLAPISSSNAAVRNNDKLKLAEMLYEGEGGDQDLSRARQLFVEILNAPAGDMDERVRRDARLKLVTMLREGQGGEQDLAKTRLILQELLDSQKSYINPKSRINPRLTSTIKFQLANMFLEGQGGSQDLPRARQLFQETIDTPMLEVSEEERNQSRLNLANMLYQGRGGTRSVSGARLLLEEIIASSGENDQEILHIAYTTLVNMRESEQS